MVLPFQGYCLILLYRDTCGKGCKTMKRKRGRGDERKRGLPYCPQWLGPSIDQRREGKTGWEGEGTNRPQGLGPNSLVASALFLSLQAGQGHRGIHQRVLSFHLSGIHTLMHVHTFIRPLKKCSSWWHHFPFCSAVRHGESKLTWPLIFPWSPILMVCKWLVVHVSLCLTCFQMKTNIYLFLLSPDS